MIFTQDVKVFQYFLKFVNEICLHVHLKKRIEVCINSLHQQRKNIFINSKEVSWH
jgi:hypothetical protein